MVTLSRSVVLSPVRRLPGLLHHQLCWIKVPIEWHGSSYRSPIAVTSQVSTSVTTSSMLRLSDGRRRCLSISTSLRLRSCRQCWWRPSLLHCPSFHDQGSCPNHCHHRRIDWRSHCLFARHSYTRNILFPRMYIQLEFYVFIKLRAVSGRFDTLFAPVS